MRAAVLDEVDGRLSIDELEIDGPAAREVLVRVAASGVCHSDLHIIDGTMPFPKPVVLGHEAAGVVEAVGREVRDIVPGDHVVLCTSSFCGRCRNCIRGKPFICSDRQWSRPAGEPPRLTRHGQPVNQLSGLGGFAEQALVGETSVVKIDPAMPFDVAALLGCGVVTGFGAVFNRAGVEVGSTVAVVGCGGVGLNVVQASAMANARVVVAVDVSAPKLDAARRMGATHVVDASERDPVEAVRAVTGGGVDHSFEVIGNPRTVVQAFEMLAPGGTTTVVGVVPFDAVVPITGALLWGEKRLQFSNMGSNRFRLDVPNYVDLYLGGRVRLDELVSRRITLDEVNEAFDALTRPGDVVRSVIVFDDGAAPH